MPVPIVAIGLGMAGGVAFEYVTSAGRASSRDYAVSALVGGIPGAGLGARAGLKGASKVSKLRHYNRKYGDKPGDIARVMLMKESSINIRPELAAIGVGVGANVVVGMAYDRITHSGSGAGTTTNRGTTTTQRSRGYGPYSSQRTRRSAPSGRRRKRCTHRDSRGRRCLRPAGHSGRHRYQ